MRPSEMIYLSSWKDIWKVVSLKKKSHQHTRICLVTHRICAVHRLCVRHYADKVITTASGVAALQAKLSLASLACFVDYIGFSSLDLSKLLIVCC